MKGVIVQTSDDPNTGRHFGIRAKISDTKGTDESNLGRDIFPVPDIQIDVRDVGPGSEVVFHTERNGKVTIDVPPPVRGERARG